MSRAPATGSTLRLRPIRPADREFLARLYASTRSEELGPVPWPEAQKRAFLQSQFEAQHAHYTQHFPDASFDVIEIEGQPAGRLYVDRREDEIRLIDIALLPEHRGGGLGTSLLHDLLAEATAAKLPVTLHVEHANPAVRLYRRLGFDADPAPETGVYQLMRWQPPHP